MGRALELLTGFVTAPGATFTANTMAAGNSNTIRNTDNDAPIKLLTAWADKQGAGVLRIRSPRLHDNVVGMSMLNLVATTTPTWPIDVPQNLFSQDTLTIEQTGSAVAGDIETSCLLVHYEDLPGINARLIDSDELLRRGVNLMSAQQTLALGTAGGYSGQVAVNSTQDNFKANTDYALVGYNVNGQCACIRWQGADTGNLGVGGPADIVQLEMMANWFKMLSDKLRMPLIPVFNSANKNAILVDGAQDENGADVIVTSIFVELAP